MYRYICPWDQTNIRRGSHAVQNSNFSTSSSYSLNYQIKRKIPITVFRPDYPQKIESLGDLIRKTRMDLGLEIKQLAEQLGVTEDSIINWEYRRKQPVPSLLKKVIKFLKPHMNGSIPKDEFWKVCFQNDKFYPQKQNNFGEKLRATRMQRFLSIPQLAKELGVDPTSIGRWELSKSEPSPESKKKVLDWIEQK